MTKNRFAAVVTLLFTYHICFTQQVDSIAFVTDSAYAASPFFGNLLITKNGKTIFERSYGYADAIMQKPLTQQNSFQVASISKQFTAYGIMLLKHKGQLDYDSAVTTYLPSFPYSNITIRHLLQHTSGLPNFWDSIRPNLDTLKSNGNNDVLIYLVQHKLPLQFIPGSTFDYCDIGYDFLASIIETLSGLEYDVFMHKHIFKPLGMKQTFAYKVTDIRKIKNKQLAIGHVLNQKQFMYAHEQAKYNFVYYLGSFYGDGSVVTTTHDLAKWDMALANCSILPCIAQQESIKPIKYNHVVLHIRNHFSYGFGWFVRDDISILYHSGSHPGNSHVYYRFPHKRIAFIFLSNAEAGNLKALRNRILELL